MQYDHKVNPLPLRAKAYTNGDYIDALMHQMDDWFEGGMSINPKMTQALKHWRLVKKMYPKKNTKEPQK